MVLCNALHFLHPGELSGLPGYPRDLPFQTIVVRNALRRADRIVVPCSDMSERVAMALPWARSRLVTRFHPITPRKRDQPAAEPYVLVPMLPAPHKDLSGAVKALVDAVVATGTGLRVAVTAHSGDLDPRLADHPLVRPIGPQTLEEMDGRLAEAAAVYAPTVIEAFGYPVAEARALGLPVLAVDCPRNRELGASALIGYKADSPDSLAAGVAALAESTPGPAPSPDPFDPERYFAWLTGA